jgi:hypothetical protein
MLKCQQLLYMTIFFRGKVQPCIGTGWCGEKYSNGDASAMETGDQEIRQQLLFE